VCKLWPTPASGAGFRPRIDSEAREWTRAFEVRSHADAGVTHGADGVAVERELTATM